MILDAKYKCDGCGAIVNDIRGSIGRKDYCNSCFLKFRIKHEMEEIRDLERSISLKQVQINMCETRIGRSENELEVKK